MCRQSKVSTAGFNGNQAVRRMSGICAELTAGVVVERSLRIMGMDVGVTG
jgi:hypothetical protein